MVVKKTDKEIWIGINEAEENIRFVEDQVVLNIAEVKERIEFYLEKEYGDGGTWYYKNIDDNESVETQCIKEFAKAFKKIKSITESLHRCSACVYPSLEINEEFQNDNFLDTDNCPIDLLLDVLYQQGWNVPVFNLSVKVDIIQFMNRSGYLQKELFEISINHDYGDPKIKWNIICKETITVKDQQYYKFGDSYVNKDFVPITKSELAKKIRND